MNEHREWNVISNIDPSYTEHWLNDNNNNNNNCNNNSCNDNCNNNTSNYNRNYQCESQPIVNKIWDDFISVRILFLH